MNERQSRAIYFEYPFFLYGCETIPIDIGRAYCLFAIAKFGVFIISPFHNDLVSRWLKCVQLCGYFYLPCAVMNVHAASWGSEAVVLCWECHINL